MAEERTAAHFLRAWNDASGSSKPDAGADRVRDSSPEALDTEKSSLGFALVGPDRLSASYPRKCTNEHDVGIVQADRPAPWRRNVYYFEISVKNAAAPACVSIGFASADCPNIRGHLGWSDGSCGHRGADGMVCDGDTLGLGVNYATGEFFSTKNGEFLGSVWKTLKGRLFPIIGLHSENVEVTVNFGKQPFLYDLEVYKAELRKAYQHVIDQMEIARSDGFRFVMNIKTGNIIIRSYLHHYGYEETLQSFDMDPETVDSLQVNGANLKKGYALHLRKIIHKRIMRGEVDKSIATLEHYFPETMKNDFSPIRFFLHSQKFVELVRDGKLSEAIVLARNEFDKFRSVLQVEDQVKDCASLLAYDLPHESCVGYLLEESHRELVADFVNAMVLSTNTNVKDEDFCPQSSLERLIRQLTACSSERMALETYQGGEDFDLREFLESW